MAAVHLPRNTELGHIEGVEVYDYLDGPKLFLCKSDWGIQYLVYWCGETRFYLEWAYLPISDERLSELKRNDIDLRTAYMNPENGIFIVFTGASGDYAMSIPTMWLDKAYPPEGHYIEHVDLWD